ncbi:PIN domain-containing protein [Streptomyces sp. Ru87]|uniref:PIN domain-containing protein n=1 Tax=Streptomyces sp. Ru87 TaxID=2044307 RepID=UPI000BF93718|nr:PIN domain-containing protein [Streptomyces sp. Ru87]PGH50500.1 VapC toxin family PIN domain ribonuclease [Streptomyces sp. Ru87]
MITYLVDTSALWHLFRTPGALRPREGHIAAGVLHICEPTRAQFPHSATPPAHRDELAEEIDALCRSSPVPESAWRWVDTAQYKLTQRAQHRAAGAIDLLVCATAVHHGHTVLHVDNGFATVSAVLKEVQQRDVRS